MPVAVFRTHRLAPRVVMANDQLRTASGRVFYDLQDKNLTMFAQYTAAPWQYIGTQGVIQGTFETLRSIGDIHFGGSLEGRDPVRAGMGGMGGNQPRAMTMLGGVCDLLSTSTSRIIREAIGGGLLRRARALARRGDRDGDGRRASASEPLGIALVGNAVDVFEACLAGGWRPDILTEMTPAHDPLAYIPAGLSAEQADVATRARPRRVLRARARIDGAPARRR